MRDHMAAGEVKRSWCRRCGSRLKKRGLCSCAPFAGDIAEIEALIADSTSAGPQSALARVCVAEARPLLEHALAGGDPAIRVACAEALANIADPRSFEVMTTAEVEAVASSALTRFLGRIGDERSIAMLTRLATEHGRIAPDATRALVKLGVPAALDALLAEARQCPWAGWAQPDRPIGPNPHPLHLLAAFRPPSALDLLLVELERASDLEEATAREMESIREETAAQIEGVRALRQGAGAEREDEDPVVAGLLERERNTSDEQRREMARQRAIGWLRGYAAAVSVYDDARARRALDEAREQSGLDLVFEGFRPPAHQIGSVLETDRTVPAWELDFTEGPVDHEGTRFGGQPSWLTEPTWPLTRDGTPMAFWGQVDVPAPSGRRAFIFIDPDECLDPADAAVICQPGPPPQLPTAPRPEGPQIPVRALDDRYTGGILTRFVARVPKLDPFFEPPEWPDGWIAVGRRGWNKVGGTPTWLQGPIDAPDLQLLCEFAASEAGFELADGAQCYVFIHPTEAEGLFHWDCH